MNPSPEVIVVGGGVVGCACAFYLARRGAKVLLLERDHIGSDASGVAAGTLAIHADGPGPLLDLGWAALKGYPKAADELKMTSGVDIEYVPLGILRPAFTEAEVQRLQANIPWQREAGYETSWLVIVHGVRIHHREHREF